MDLRPRALEVLRLADPVQKAAAAQALLAALHDGTLAIDPGATLFTRML